LPTRELVELCYSGRFTKEQLFAELTLRGGLRSYLGDNRMENIEKRITAGDAQAKLVVDAMIYQIAKAVGAMCVAAGPDVDGIVLTGGLARSELVVRGLKAQVGHLAPVFVLEQTTEMERMALGAMRVLDGTEKARRYVPPTERRQKP
jgi:butyrate kinase